jgi:glycosyltransferase 2 family protein
LKRLLITLLKIGLSVAIIAYLVHQTDKQVFLSLVNQPKRWDLLFGGWVCCFGAVLFTFVRWWYLVCALDIPLRFRDSIRIGYWGYLFNFLPLGIVGGDVVKTVMLDLEHKGNRAKALATVLVDRVFGLYVLFIVASVAILLTQFWNRNLPSIYVICMATLGLTVVGTAGLGIVLGPESLVGGMIRTVARIPRLGPPLEAVIKAVRMYNRKPRVLLVVSLMTVPVHLLNALGFYLIACALFDGDLTKLSLSAHFVVVPLSTAMQVIPLPMGPTEGFLNYLYPTVAKSGVVITKGQGLVVGLAYRLLCLLIAATGLYYYFGNRREMAEVMHEAEVDEAVV